MLQTSRIFRTRVNSIFSDLTAERNVSHASPPTQRTGIKKLSMFLTIIVLLGSASSSTATPFGPLSGQTTVYLPLILSPASPELAAVGRATYASLNSMVEPSTGLIHDRFDASLFDILPQFAVIRTFPYVSKAVGATLTVERCRDPGCSYQGDYGLKLTYAMPPATWGSYNVDSREFDVHQAQYLDLWIRGEHGGEGLEVVLWSDCQAGFPGRPESAQLTASTAWEKKRIALADFENYADIFSLCRLSLGFNDAIHPGGTLYVDQVAFVDEADGLVHVPVDEETNVSNVGLFISSVAGAVRLGIVPRADAVTLLGRTLTSLEALPKWHGFPQTHNFIVSLQPSDGDRCISTVDSGNLAAGLIVLRQAFPELAGPAGRLLDDMEWDWLFDPAANLPYGCRYPNGSASTTWHYEWLAADSRLAHFIGIGAGAFPASSWSALNRAHETPRCSALWHFEPGWDGGGLFMQGLPAIFIDELGSELDTSYTNFIEDQVCLADHLGAPAWGWSAAGFPPYGQEYCGYGDNCDDLLAPYACLLAADHLPTAALIANLHALDALNAHKRATNGVDTFDFGFRDSVLWRTGEVAEFYLSLDQGMAFLGLANLHTEGILRAWFCQDPITQQAIQMIPDYAGSCN